MNEVNRARAVARPGAATHGLDDVEAAAPTLLEQHGMRLALLVAWIAMLGSLYFSEVMHFVPCPLCWYQRILMYPLAAVIAVGLLRRDAGLALYVLPLSLLGIGVSSYHLLIERGFIRESAACQVGVSCAVRYINWFGFITIPLLAFTAFAIISLAASASWRGRDVVVPPPAPPWRAVAGIVGGVCLAFALLTWWHGGSPPADATIVTPTPPAVDIPLPGG